jgi:hypothetical protein
MNIGILRLPYSTILQHHDVLRVCSSSQDHRSVLEIDDAKGIELPSRKWSDVVRSNFDPWNKQKDDIL